MGDIFWGDRFITKIKIPNVLTGKHRKDLNLVQVDYYVYRTKSCNTLYFQTSELDQHLELKNLLFPLEKSYPGFTKRVCTVWEKGVASRHEPELTTYKNATVYTRWVD